MGLSRTKSLSKPPHATTRPIQRSVAGVLEDLELDQPLIVQLKDLDLIARRRGAAISAQDIAERLQRDGWLLPLRTRGSYEFAPAARAGRLRSGDPFIELRATLRRRSKLHITVAYESAAWLHGLSMHPPDQQVLSIPKTAEPPPALSGYRIVHQVAKLLPETINELPVWSIESLLVCMAARPAAYRDWPNVHEWLARAAQRVDIDALLSEGRGHSQATLVRLAYLLDKAQRPDLAEQTTQTIGPWRGPIYFGAARRGGHYDANYDLIDSVLAFE